VSLRVRTLWTAATVVLILFLAFPSFFDKEERLASPWIPDFGVNLGLDLQGGIHWLLRIDTDTALAQELQRDERVLREVFQEAGIVAEIKLVDNRHLQVRAEPATLVQARAKVEELFDSLDIQSSDGTLELALSRAWHRDVVERGVRQALEVLRRRIDSLGVTEPVIAPQGEGRILVQMPGEIDPARARAVIEKTTFLEFKPVLDSAADPALLLAKHDGTLPPDTQVVVLPNDRGGVTEAFLVPSQPMLTGAMLEDARLGFDDRTRPVVEFTWNADGTRIFREFTGQNIGRRLAAVIDGQVVTAPVIQARIGQRGVIEGRFTRLEAADLSVKLRSGALPIPLVIEEERSVGPALGSDSIGQGVRAALLGSVLVFVFMAVYYGFAGVLTDVTLLLNLAIVLGAMGLAGATLTLPGIAGLVLTVGMAVDSNVIIFERIREEQRAGKTLRNAVTAGFKRSSLTILDAQITTMIAALVLLYFGRGPVQGFGVTLAVGIAASVFCALFVSRLLIDLLLARFGQLRI
jgi:preprotein translocase subunit SecD